MVSVPSYNAVNNNYTITVDIRGQRGNFAPTSSDFDISDSFAGKNGYNYIIDTDRGINTVKFFGERHPFPEQKEFSIPNGIKIRK